MQTKSGSLQGDLGIYIPISSLLTAPMQGRLDGSLCYTAVVTQYKLGWLESRRPYLAQGSGVWKL